jgi:hypothetical protein
MPKYKVTVCRTGYGFTTFEVEASGLTEARQKALDTAGNYDYIEKSGEYEIESIQGEN